MERADIKRLLPHPKRDEFLWGFHSRCCHPPSLVGWSIRIRASSCVSPISHSSSFLDDLSRVDTRHRTEMRKRAEARTHARQGTPARAPRQEGERRRRRDGEGEGDGEEGVKTNPRRISSGSRHGNAASAKFLVVDHVPRRFLIGHHQLPPRQGAEIQECIAQRNDKSG